MFRFTASGRIGSINAYKGNTLSISLAADRLVEGRDGSFTVTDWLRCVSFAPALNDRMQAALEIGQLVTLEGRLVPRVKDKTAEKKEYETTLEITGFTAGAKPKAATPAQPADASA